MNIRFILRRFPHHVDGNLLPLPTHSLFCRTIKKGERLLIPFHCTPHFYSCKCLSCHYRLPLLQRSWRSAKVSNPSRYLIVTTTCLMLNKESHKVSGHECTSAMYCPFMQDQNYCLFAWDQSIAKTFSSCIFVTFGYFFSNFYV